MLVSLILRATPAGAQTLEQRLLQESPEAIARAANEQGDAKRGAIVFHQPQMACAKCHTPGGGEHETRRTLGPDLTVWNETPTDADLVDSVLRPSQQIRKGYEPLTLVTKRGETVTGLVVEVTPVLITLRDPSTSRLLRFLTDDIDERAVSKTSIMPPGQVNQLASRQQFLDLIRYLIDIRDGGPARAKELQPPPSLYALQLPEYESHVDHAGLIRDLNDEAFRRGEAIYKRLCINCHGDHNGPGSLPTALRFGEGRFKNGHDPFAMYQTLTRGFGFMAPQSWMVPQQKYDVIHYIRRAYLQHRNPSQFFDVTDAYLQGLPPGDTRGPEPTVIEPWVNMDYGPSLVNTYEIGSDGSNFAYKGIAVRLDPGAGGVSRGNAWMIFDHDTFRVAAAWTADPTRPEERFIDWNGIQFNGMHQVHPRIVGQVCFANPTGPGWADPRTGSFVDDQRVLGRDERRYGPLPAAWARFRGSYANGDKTITSYSVGTTEVLEMPGLIESTPILGTPQQAAPPAFTRTFNLGPRERDLTLLVATHPGRSPQLSVHDGVARFAPGTRQASTDGVPVFDGAAYLESASAGDFDMTHKDYTISATIRTTQGGTIFCKTVPADKWAPDGKTFFVRGGRLCFDIGWVGVVQSRGAVDDGQWHHVGLTWDHDTARATLYVDGTEQGSRVLRPKNDEDGHVVRIGYTAPDFPAPQSFFQGELRHVAFTQRLRPSVEIAAEAENTRANPAAISRKDDLAVASWPLTGASIDTALSDSTGHEHRLVLHRDAGTGRADAILLAGLSTQIPDARWHTDGQRLLFTIPAGQAGLRFTLWQSTTTRDEPGFDPPQFDDPAPDLERQTRGGAPRWPQQLTTTPVIGDDAGPFAVDVLTPPDNNPWLAQLRLTGLDFFDEPDRMAVCSWDGDVWLVSGLSNVVASLRDADSAASSLTWRRIASGLFQPLGLKIVRGDIYITCRDQIVILRDFNGDGETDFYDCFNNDQQVTDHFHEFAMGLQVDDRGNFYYAKSARHALPAVVPQHGTLLRVSPDGSRTDIIATGFRAANGVCLNPDGTFVVTDQEGHWNPKNRINWVREGGFYGNMFGYHNVTDESDSAMEQPLCWITNVFDRSPAELLWATSERWGPLKGRLINLSYGYGKVYVVPFEDVGGQKQGGMCELPIPQFPTGIIRGRFHPVDGQLYLCGMYSWAGSQQQPGGLYRLRATGKPSWLPIELSATKTGLTITFSDPLDRTAAVDAGNYHIRVWSLKRTANYGSEHFDEHALTVTAASVSDDGRTVTLAVPEIAPTWCIEVRCRLRSEAGAGFERVIHGTIHELAPSRG
jgi:putative heme-binding domain-containing protein